AIDLLPTLADLAHVPVAGVKPLDGISLKPLLLATAKDWPDRIIFSHWNGKVSVRSQRYRLDDDNRLFDMETDPVQDHNVAADHKDISGRLSKARAKWKADLLPGLENDHRPFPVGYREFPIT